MTTLTANEAGPDLHRLVANTTARHQVYRIHHQEDCAILLSEDDYEALVETLQLLSVPGFRESIQRSVREMETGDTFSMAEVFGDEE